MKPGAEGYFKVAEGWFQDKYGTMKTQRNWAYLLAIVSTIAVIAMALGITTILPLKTVEPYVIRVDSSSGDVNIVSTLDSTDEQWLELTAEEALIQHLLVQYVVAHQTYSKIDLTRLFNWVRIHSSNEVFSPYERQWRHPTDSPFSRYEDDTVEVEVKSITFFNDDTATVRFNTLWERKSGGTVQGSYVAVVRWKFVRAAIALDERWTNPLGFIVTSFRVDQEKVEELK